ncbi:MAG: SURF1 family protein [Trueperaceae bacterium]
MTRLLRPRLLPWHLLVIAICALFATAGSWQLSRHQQLLDRNALLSERLVADAEPYPVAAEQYDPDASAGTPRDPRYRPVVAVGRFAPEHEVLWRSRAFDGQPGYHVLTPFVLHDDPTGAAGAGRVLLVNRGWIPYRYAEPEVPAFDPPAGPVRVEGRLMPAQGTPEGPLAAFAPRDPPDGVLDTVARPNVGRLQAQMPWPLDRFVLEAETLVRVGGATDAGEVWATVAEDGLDVSGGTLRLPLIPPAPAPEGGPHLGYAFQWFSFLMITLIGYVLLLRRRLFVPTRRG